MSIKTSPPSSVHHRTSTPAKVLSISSILWGYILQPLSLVLLLLCRRRNLILKSLSFIRTWTKGTTIRHPKRPNPTIPPVHRHRPTKHHLYFLNGRRPLQTWAKNWFSSLFYYLLTYPPVQGRPGCRLIRWNRSIEIVYSELATAHHTKHRQWPRSISECGFWSA